MVGGWLAWVAGCLGGWVTDFLDCLGFFGFFGFFLDVFGFF